MRRVAAVVGLLALLVLPVGADQMFPKPDWKDALDPLASPLAVPGGDITMFLSQEPDSINYYLDNSFQAAAIMGMMYDSLLGSDGLTLEETPGLANKWSISDDKLTFTFWLDPRAKWSDGQPITAADVKATYDAVMACDKAGAIKISLERFSSPVVVDERTVKFTAKTVHWANLDSISGFWILPKHLLDKTTLEKLEWDFPIVSGPYERGERTLHQNVTMNKRANYWAKDLLVNKYKNNFDKIKFRFFDDPNNAMEAFKKGDLDIYEVNVSRIWMEQTKGEKFDNNWIVKQRIFNYDAIGFQGWAMNARREPFKDVRVREALAHLVNRPKMNETLMYNVYQLHRSYYEDLYNSTTHPNTNVEVDYNPEKARALFKEAGWVVNPQSGKLEKDGKPFTFHWLDREKTNSKFMALFREDVGKLGITFEEDIKDWASWQKDMEEFNFDMTWCAWGGGIHKDPEDMWFSKEADRKSGNNVTGFKDAKVDELIEKQKAIFDVNERHEIVRQIDGIVTKQFPYILLWYKNNTRLLYWNKFGMPAWVLGKYGNEFSSLAYWWYDEDQAAGLKDAMASGKALRAHPADVRFDGTFKPAPAK